MTRNENGLHIRRQSVSKRLKVLSKYLERAESRHGCAADVAIRELAEGSREETPEISRWLNNYRTYLRLASHAGGEPGTTTSTTRRST